MSDSERVSIRDINNQLKEMGVPQGQRIKALFNISGKTYESLWLCDKSDISKTIHGKRKTRRVQRKVSECLGIPEEELFG